MVQYLYDLPEIDFVGGASKDLIFHVYVNKNKPKPFGLTECTANFAIINFVNRNGDPIVSRPMEVRLSEDETVYNVLSVKLSPLDTVDLHGKYIYQISIKDLDGNAEDPKQGIINIHGNINKGFLRE